MSGRIRTNFNKFVGLPYSPAERLSRNGGRVVAGLDEVGRGAAAGPLIACACVLGPNFRSERINDSKKMSFNQRLVVSDELKSDDKVSYALGTVSADEVDEGGVGIANYLGFLRAFLNLKKSGTSPDVLFVDGLRRLRSLYCVLEHFNEDCSPKDLKAFVNSPEIKAKTRAHRLSIGKCKVDMVKIGGMEVRVGSDQVERCVAAASIIAKSTRDVQMIDMDEQCPGYGLARNKGYLTEEHREMLDKHGAKTFHRFSFRRVGFVDYSVFDGQGLRSRDESASQNSP